MGIKIRKDPYIIKKGIHYSDQSEQELISYEGKAHTAENIDNQSLTLKSYAAEDTLTFDKK